MRIAIAETLRMFREAIVKACETEFGHEVVSEVDSGLRAIVSVQRTNPDVLILDLSLPDLDGFTVIDRLRASGSLTKILVLSAYSDDYTVFRLEKANIHGFVDKRQNAVAILKEALQAIGNGTKYFSPTFESARRARHADSKSFDKILSESEQRILCLIGEGLTNDEIGQKIGISPRTVQKHRHNILHKLEISSTPKLIAFAMRHGFATRNPPLNSGRAGEIPPAEVNLAPQT